MDNSYKNAEKFLKDFLKRNNPDWLSGYPDLIRFLMEYEASTKIKEQRKKKLEKINELCLIINREFPPDAHSFEVFNISECKETPSGMEAYIGFKTLNNDFHFFSVPYTGIKRERKVKLNKINKL